MPRSGYIYIAMRGGVPQAAATVKRELADWYNAQPDQAGIDLWRASGWPAPNATDQAVPMPVKELMGKRGSF
jgi:hypothetical protein